MANALYPLWKASLLTQADTYNSLDTASTYPVKAALIDHSVHGYSASDQYWAIFATTNPTAILGTPGTIGTRTVTAGAFNGDDITYTAVAAGAGPVDAIVLYIDTGTPATSRLVAWLDTGVTGLPVTPNGGNITITWDTTIFTL